MLNNASSVHLYRALMDFWYEADGAVAHMTKKTSDPLPLVGGTDIVAFDLRGQTVTIHATLGYRNSKEGKRVVAPGRLIIKETGQNLYNGDPSLDPRQDQTAIELTEPFVGWRARLVLERLPHKRQVDGPKGRTCGQCRWWDQKEGTKILTEKTHMLASKEGGYCFADVVARALAEEFRAPYLHPENAGFCPRRRELIDAKGGACKEFEQLKVGAWSRFWAWVRR